ncbi:MAG TPA: hypothetical protein DGT21_19625 [Armatimonadetes bacterium]|nr:hypothetical protein [Armatimonadota bacterium]
MRLLDRLALMTLSVCLLLAVVGCGGHKSARAVAEAFLTAMKNGDMAGAADRWDYSAAGRAGNADWDTFGKGQRDLIVKEMKWAEARAKELEYWRTRFPRATKIMSVAEEGDTAIVTLEGGGATQITLIKVGEDWFVSKLN